MKITVLTSVAHATFDILPGSVVEVSPEVGEAWIAEQLAVEAPEDAAVTAELPHVRVAAAEEQLANEAAAEATTLEPVLSAEPTAAAAAPPESQEEHGV